MKNQKEVFKDVPNFKGIYQVSNIGRVKNVEKKGSLNNELKASDLYQLALKNINLYKETAKQFRNTLKKL